MAPISRDPRGSRNHAGACRRSSVRWLCRDFDQTNRQSNVAGGFTCLIASVSPLSVFPNERRRVTPVVERSSPCDAEHAVERMVRGNQSGTCRPVRSTQRFCVRTRTACAARSWRCRRGRAGGLLASVATGAAIRYEPSELSRLARNDGEGLLSLSAQCVNA